MNSCTPDIVRHFWATAISMIRKATARPLVAAAKHSGGYGRLRRSHLSRAGDGNDIGLLYSRIQINSEKHTQEIKVIGVSKICNILPQFAIRLVKFEIDTISCWPKLHEV